MTPREVLAIAYLEERIETLGRSLLVLDVRSDAYTEALVELDRLIGILDLDDDESGLRAEPIGDLP